MACGDKYTHLLQAGGGRTVDEPAEYWCNEIDAQAWYGQATAVKKLQVQAWNALMAIENANDAWPQTDKLRAASDAYEAVYNSLPTPSAWMAFSMGGCMEAIQEMIANLQQGACMLEKLNDAIISYGVDPIDPGAPGGKGSGAAWPWVVGGVVVLGAIGAGVYYSITRPSSTPSTTVVLARSGNGNGNGKRNGNGNGNGRRNGNGARP